MQNQNDLQIKKKEINAKVWWIKNSEYRIRKRETESSMNELRAREEKDRSKQKINELIRNQNDLK